VASAVFSWIFFGVEFRLLRHDEAGRAVSSAFSVLHFLSVALDTLLAGSR